MTEDQAQPSPPEAAAAQRPAAQPTHEQAEQSSKVRSAADAVRRAKAELEKAQQLYEKVRHQAAEKLKQARETTVGDVIDGVLTVVKRFPGPSVLVALAIGFFLGRQLRK